jgi:hypothetical protein
MRHECWFNMFSKGFTVDLWFLMFLQDQIPPEFNAFLPQRFLELSDSCDVIMYQITCFPLAATLIMTVMCFWFRLTSWWIVWRPIAVGTTTLLRFAVWPFRNPAFVQVKDQIVNTTLHRFFHSANCSKQKFSSYLQARIFLGLADRLCQIVFSCHIKNESIHSQVMALRNLPAQ